MRFVCVCTLATMIALCLVSILGEFEGLTWIVPMGRFQGNTVCARVCVCVCVMVWSMQAWDDVERKIKPAEKPYDYSRSRPLEQEKSKLSLAEVYEQEYLKQTQVRCHVHVM